MVSCETDLTSIFWKNLFSHCYSSIIHKETKKMSERKVFNQLVLIRHGESEWNSKNLFTGWCDVALSEKGMSFSPPDGDRSDRRRVRGPQRRQALEGGGLRLRWGLHFSPQESHQDPLDLPRGDRPDVDPRHQNLETQRETLRRSSGSEQAGDRRQVRHRSGMPLLECPMASRSWSGDVPTIFLLQLSMSSPPTILRTREGIFRPDGVTA